jgi:hypothetical protein
MVIPIVKGKKRLKLMVNTLVKGNKRVRALLMRAPYFTGGSSCATTALLSTAQFLQPHYSFLMSCDPCGTAIRSIDW